MPYGPGREVGCNNSPDARTGFRFGVIVLTISSISSESLSRAPLGSEGLPRVNRLQTLASPLLSDKVISLSCQVSLSGTQAWKSSQASIAPGVNSMRIWPGRPYPLGATWDGAGVNFSLFSEHGTKV